VLERVGEFDEHYFFYWEDTELSWRLYRAEYKVLMVPKSWVYHEAHGTFKKLPSKFTSYLTMRNQLILLLTYYNKKQIVSNFIPLYVIRFLQPFKAPNRGAKLKAVLTLGKEIGYVMKKRSEIRKLTVCTDDRFLSYLGRNPFGFVELRSVAEGIRYKMSAKATV